MMPMPSTPAHQPHPSTGARLVATDGRQLPLRGTSLNVVASAGLSRVVLVQRFDNPYDEPLTVRYQLPLPADGAVSGFAFQLGDRRIVGEVDGRDRARRRFEKAVVEGRSAGLVEQSRSSLFRQELGNVPPRATVLAEITIDHPLKWLAEGAWEWRFPTVVAPRYQGEPGRVADRNEQNVDVADGPIDARAQLELIIAEPLADGGAPTSPTHALNVQEGRRTVVGLRSRGGVALDRDIAVRWPARGEDVITRLEVARPEAGHPGAEDAFGLLTLVPPRGEAPSVARDLILLLDTSGSMAGEPLAQARRVAMALVESLDDEDSLQMVSFSSRVSHWSAEPRRADRPTRRDAIGWLDALEAGGGTEMHQGILAALEPLRADAQRQVILVTDGLIGFEDEIVGAIDSRLPRGCRVHCVGVGSAVNRSLTGPAARAGRGIESICTLGEDAERVAMRLVAHCAAPLVIDLELQGDALRQQAPCALPDLLAGAPASVSVRLDPAGGELRITGRTPGGRWEHVLEVPSVDRGQGPQGLVTRFAREQVQDLETALAAAPQRRGAIDAEIERIALDFQIASRLTSWVAVSDRIDVDPQSPSRREEMPHELPQGMSLTGLGLRAPQPRLWAAQAMPAMVSMPAPQAASGGAPPGFGTPPPASPSPPHFERARRPAGPPPPARAAAAPPPPPGGALPPDSFREDAPTLDDDLDDEITADEVLEEASLALEGGEMPRGSMRAEDGPVDADEATPIEVRDARRSLARRLLDGVRDVLGGRRPIEARGRIVVDDEQHLVIEVTIPVDLTWSPVTARVIAADGRALELGVDPRASTRRGDVVAGQTVRLSLTIDRPIATHPEVVHLVLDQGTMTIHLVA